MEKILTVSLPIFALLFSGYGAGRLRLLNEPAVVGLNGTGRARSARGSSATRFCCRSSGARC
ncbi:MAG: hypothetical protein HYY64_17455 [Candidatus Rokubacteria bacterium]|nr:hypothetical protein [Candidatus Rokubacteria bacterium]